MFQIACVLFEVAQILYIFLIVLKFWWPHWNTILTIERVLTIRVCHGVHHVKRWGLGSTWVRWLSGAILLIMLLELELLVNTVHNSCWDNFDTNWLFWINLHRCMEIWLTKPWTYIQKCWFFWDNPVVFKLPGKFFEIKRVFFAGLLYVEVDVLAYSQICGKRSLYYSKNITQIVNLDNLLILLTRVISPYPMEAFVSSIHFFSSGCSNSVLFWRESYLLYRSMGSLADQRRLLYLSISA